MNDAKRITLIEESSESNGASPGQIAPAEGFICAAAQTGLHQMPKFRLYTRWMI